MSIPLIDASPAARPRRTTLAGRFVTLVPLDAAAHGPALWNELKGAEHDGLWQYLFDGPYREYAAFEQALARKAATDDPLFFAIASEGRAVGYASLMRIEPAHRCIEVGSILFSPALQRTAGATEAMYLMARHVFEDLGYRRYEWKCDARNEPTRRAALRLGFSFEGIFRQHMIVKARNRDTAWFSMIDGEWPSRKAACERWLAPSNFDEAGAQRVRLADCG
jgi:RimJ/RimL family protein N-acetyltransferase